MKSKSGFAIAEVLFGLVVVVLLVGGFLAYHSRHAKNEPATSFKNYVECTKHGGQVLIYDGAIQFNACRGGDNLYLQYSSQNTPRIDQNKISKTANTVVGSGSSDLISYLTTSNEGCPGYYKVVKEVPGWALLNYGCAKDSASDLSQNFLVAMKLSGGWVQISPTNNFRNDGKPSCLMVDMFKIPGALTPKCYQNTGYGDDTLRTDSY